MAISRRKRGLGGLPNKVTGNTTNTPITPNNELLFKPPYGGFKDKQAPSNKPATLESIQQLLLQFMQIVEDSDGPLNFAVSPISAGTTQKSVLSDNPLRRYLLIQNVHATAEIYVGFGYIPTANNGVTVVAGGNYEPYRAPRNSVRILSDTANTQVIVLEGYINN